VTLIAQDDRAYLTTEHDERYALGDPTNPLLVLNAADDDGCLWAADVPDGWDFPEVDTPVDRRQDGHGGYAGEPTYNPRPLTFDGSVAAPSRDAGSAVAVTVAQIPNVGDEDSHVVYTVTGPVPQPRIALGTGQYVQLTADLAALDVWVVDTAAGTSQVNGVNRYDAWGAGSVFPLIPGTRLNPDGSVTPGGTEVRLRSSSGGTDQTAGLTVTTAPSWK
jgi:hypothetical protein